MADQKISQLDIATSSLADDNLVIQRGFDNLSLAVGLISTGGGDTGSFVTTSSISGTTQTFTKGDGSTYTNEIVSASFAVSASYAVSSSVEITKEVSSSYADTASYFDTDPISASLTTTDQTISSSVASLSGSASDARNQLATDYIAADTALSASLTTTDQTISASVASLSGSASDARNQLAADYIAADTALSASLTTTDQTISASVASLSGSASTARDAIASDLNTQSSSFASDRVMRAGDTMTGRLVINNNTDFGLDVERPSGNEPGISFVQDGIARTILHQNLATPYGLSITDAAKTTLRPIHIADPTIAEQAATKNYADSNFVELSGDTMTDTLTINKSGDAVDDDDLPLGVIGSGLIVGDRAGDTRTFKSGSVVQFRDYGEAHWRLMNSASQFTIEQNSGGANDGAYITFPKTTKDLTFAGKLTNVTDPTGSQDAATKKYVDDKTASITKAGVYSTADTATAIATNQKLTFNYWSDRLSFTSDASAVSWSNTNNEFSIGEGTWEFTFSFRNDTSSTPSYIRMYINTTAGAAAASGTRITAAVVNNAEEYTYFRTFYTVASGTTRYLHFNNSGALNGRFMQASVEKLTD